MDDGNPERKGDLEVRDSKIQGLGVFVRRPFRRGATVLEIDDSDPVPDRSKLTPEQTVHIDVFVGVDGNPKATFMKSPEKYINTSCDPNLVIRTDMKTGVRKAFALMDIREGDELTWDYAINSDEEWEIPVACNCGAVSCRKVIRGNYFTLPVEVQRRYVPLLDEPFRSKYAKEIAGLESEPRK